jgi:hypothetical protein
MNSDTQYYYNASGQAAAITTDKMNQGPWGVEMLNHTVLDTDLTEELILFSNAWLAFRDEIEDSTKTSKNFVLL